MRRSAVAAELCAGSLLPQGAFAGPAIDEILRSPPLVALLRPPFEAGSHRMIDVPVRAAGSSPKSSALTYVQRLGARTCGEYQSRCVSARRWMARNISASPLADRAVETRRRQA